MVSLAMIGNPPIILLDEPSTGMDPEARHDMWNVIQKISTTNKQSSVIITTHTMDEAEALSRRIAILVEGEMKCIGQKQYLKDKFGQGYEIDLKIIEPTQQQINDLISQNTSYTSGVGLQKHSKADCKDHVNEEDVLSVIKKMGGSEAMFKEIRANGAGAAIRLSVAWL